MEGPFKIAFVCTGNRFRSVLASAAFSAAAGEVPLTVESYGTLDVGPLAPLPGALRGAAAHGLDVSANRARSLTGADLHDADVIVGFELEHLVAAMETAGAPLDRSFSLPELIGLLERAQPESLDDPIRAARSRVARAHELRRSDARRTVPEIADPIAMSEADQETIARRVCKDSRALAERLFRR